jgi:hypothetical protein
MQMATLETYLSVPDGTESRIEIDIRFPSRRLLRLAHRETHVQKFKKYK